ncbi:MAG: ClpXP protease specificity-enhancing factor SspB, partial [Acidobacteriota bacterium]|nr:ClpXP protease specificity-enhancing factor SspB [Acidobacteriota bacterium]
RTDHPGVSLPTFLRERYPEEMTIALQHQFWGLMVDEEAFSVTLAFEGSRHSVTVPFEAVVAFADPVAEFTLQLKPILPAEEEPLAAQEAEPEDAAGEDAAEGDGGEGEGARVVDFEAFRKR